MWGDGEDDGAVWCTACQMWLNGPTQWEHHKIGSKHRKHANREAAAVAEREAAEALAADEAAAASRAAAEAVAVRVVAAVALAAALAAATVFLRRYR